MSFFDENGPDAVARVAHLARLQVNSEDARTLARELNAILGMMEQMNRVDTTNIAPLAHPLDVTQRLRADEVTEPDQRERLQSLSTAVEDGFYLVPRVIE